MCRPVRCRSCGNTTWAGCGQHVEQVMAGVPKDRQCTCATDTAGGTTGTRGRPSLLGRLFGG